MTVEDFEDFRERVLSWRDIDSPTEACSRCGGAGGRTYASTATWRGGIGGQSLTWDVCDSCWGSGRSDRAWPSHRSIARLQARVEELEREIRIAVSQLHASDEAEDAHVLEALAVLEGAVREIGAPQLTVGECSSCGHSAREHISPALDLGLPYGGDTCQWGACDCKSFEGER